MEVQRPHRIVVAGQVPPPLHGQALCIAQTLELLRGFRDFEVAHLPFRFSRDMQDIRRPRLGKLAEVFRVWSRVLRLRASGAIDCLLFPAGGPHKVPLVRDILLLPACLLLARRVVIVFHAGGIAAALPRLPRYLSHCIRALYRRAAAAIVLTEAGREDATATGIHCAHIVPNGLPDERRPASRSDGSLINLLCIGHLCPDKGTPELIAALRPLRKRWPGIRLLLMGEPSPPWTADDLRDTIDAHGVSDVVRVAGVLSGDAKWDAFASADIVVFPSRAPYEGFPLALVEAMMWGLPVVASRWRGIPEVMGEAFGGAFIEAPLDDASIAAAVEHVVEARQQWPAMGETNRKRYEAHFQVPAVAARLRHAILLTLERQR